MKTAKFIVLLFQLLVFAAFIEHYRPCVCVCCHLVYVAIVLDNLQIKWSWLYFLMHRKVISFSTLFGLHQVQCEYLYIHKNFNSLHFSMWTKVILLFSFRLSCRAVHHFGNVNVTAYFPQRNYGLRIKVLQTFAIS